MERRQFLVGCSAAAIVTTMERPRQLLTFNDGAPALNVSGGRQAFKALLGNTFRAYDGDGRYRARLQLLAMQDSAHCCERLDQFTLVWQGADDSPLLEGTYYLTNQASAAFEVHIGPAGSAAGQYQSPFALLRPQQI